MTENASPQPQRLSEPSGEVVIVPMSAGIVHDVAKVHRDALPGSRTAMMGEPYVAAYIDWFQRSRESRVALAAVDHAGHVLGYAVGAPLGYPKSLSRHLAGPAARAVFGRPWLFLKQPFRQGLLDRVELLLGHPAARGEPAPELPEPTMSLVAIGISRAARRRQIGTRLLQAFETKARALHMQSMRLSLHPDNFTARRFYEACGWEPFSVSAQRMYYSRFL